MYQIQMKDASGWVTLGGLWGGSETGERMSQFQEHYMVRSVPKNPKSALTCIREFRAIRVDWRPGE